MGRRRRLASAPFLVRQGGAPAVPTAIVAGLVAAALALTCAAPVDAASGRLTRYPYLTDLVTSSVTVNWATARSAAAGTVRYGRVGTERCTARVARARRSSILVGRVPQTQWSARLRLAPDQRYCYRVRLGRLDLLGRDPAPTFLSQLPPRSSKPVTFAVLGDWGAARADGNPGQAELLRRLAGSDARFALGTGDTAYPSGSQLNYGDLRQSGAGISAVFGPLFWRAPGASLPLFNALGNHGFNRTHLAVWPTAIAASSSGGRYALARHCCVNGTSPAQYPDAWYAFDAGPARFYVLTAAWPDGNLGQATAYEDDYDAHWRPTSPQRRWLTRDLAAHPSGLKFAVFHHPLYADNATEPSDTHLQGPRSLEGLLGRHGVAIAFNGHAHIYQRNVKPHAGGLITYVSGGGGGPPQPVGRCSPVDAYAIGWSTRRSRGSACGAASAPTSVAQLLHFLEVTATRSSVTVAPTDARGRTFDVQTYRVERGRIVP